MKIVVTVTNDDGGEAIALYEGFKCQSVCQFYLAGIAFAGLNAAMDDLNGQVVPPHE